MDRFDIEGLIDFGEPTERQREVLETYIELRSKRAVAQKLGITPCNVRKVLKAVQKRASLKGWSPHADRQGLAGEGFNVKGKSTLYGDDGEVKLQWVKTDRETQALLEAMQAAVEAMAEEVVREEPIPLPKTQFRQELLNCYVITDYHIGMRAWSEETRGDNWDVAIAENLLAKWFQSAIMSAPRAGTAVLCQLGDFLHWDGLDSVTPGHGFVLDGDTRIQKVVRIAIRVLRKVISMLLESHEKVHVIMAEGNHDPTGSVWLRELFKALYENEPRVSVDLSPDPYYCYEFGKTSLFFHHGHKRKVPSIDDVFVGKFRDVFGRTEHSYAHTGHLHHDQVRETNLMLVEQHRTLAAPDSYASRGGWLSGRSAKVITYHHKYGEVGKFTITPEMVEFAG